MKILSLFRKATLLYKTDKIDFFFRVGMAWRIVYGLARIVVGILLLHLIGTQLSDIFLSLMQHELIEDPNDLIFRLINSLFQYAPYTISSFLSAYLIFWGIIDIVLSGSLLMEIRWAFPVSIVTIGLFVIYELYRLSYTHSIVLAIVVTVDIALIWIIKREYQKRFSG